MCLTPILIKNPNFVNPSHSDKHSSSLSYLYNTKDKFIAVPCGNCKECLSLKQSYITQRCREEFKYNFCFMVTLTYQTCMRPYKILGDFKHYYFDPRDFQLFVKRIRKDNLLPPFKYIAFTEYGGERHLPHIHALFYFSRDLFSDLTPIELESKFEDVIKSQWKRKVSGNSFSPVYKPLSKFIRYFDYKENCWKGTYDVHFVTNDLGNSSDPTDVAYYCSKYCLKYDEWLKNKRGMLWHNYPDQYKILWKLFRPRMFVSKGFGINEDFTPDFIKQCIAQSKSFKALVPQYYTEDGKAVALSRYYQSKYLTIPDKWYFIVNNPSAFIPDGCSIPEDATLISRSFSLQDIQDYDRRCSQFVRLRNRLYEDSDFFLTEFEDTSDSLDFQDSGVYDPVLFDSDVSEFSSIRDFIVDSPLNPHSYDC